MNEQRLWVTAYVSSGREILETRATLLHPPLLFEFDGQHIARAVTQQALDDTRASGCKVRFYSILDPF
jgi:hypothetical protein